MEPLERNSHYAQIAGAFIGLLCFVVSSVSLWLQIKWKHENESVQSKAGGIIVNTPTWILIALLCTGVILILINIYLWRKRPKQSGSAVLPHPSLPVLRPKIYPARYGERASDRRSGLFIRNDGETAFSILVHPARIGTSLLDFWSGVAVLAKDAGEMLVESHIQKASGTGTFGTALMGEMAKFGLPSVPLKITYKDGDNRWYVTEFELERDVLAQGGISVKFNGQKLTTDPTGSDNTSDRKDLPGRLISMAEELEEFLEGLGPEPEIIFRGGMSAQEYTDENKAHQIRSNKMEAMYIRRFQPRVIDVYNEACELGTVHDAELERLFRSQRMDHDDAIKAVVARLRAIAGDLFSHGGTQ